jgi:uncharacterized protein YndB with AHSA1/START domain
VADRSRGYAVRLEIAARPSRIWTALTTTRLLAEWLTANADIDGRTGGSFRVTLENGTERRAHIDVYTPPSRLRLIYLPHPALAEIDSVIVDDFMIDGAAGRPTRLSLLGSGFPREFEYAEYFQLAQSSWTRALNRMKILVERPLPEKVK